MKAIQTIDENKAAKIMGIAVQTLRNWRHLKKGPSYIKLGASVRYELNDILNYIRSKRIDPENGGVTAPDD